jgi:hypothetical protein
MITDLQDYLVKRKNIYPTYTITLESKLDSTGVFLYRAEITDVYNGQWSNSIQGAFDSLENYLRSIQEIV